MATAKKKSELTLQMLVIAALQQQYWVSSQKMKILPRLTKKVDGDRLREALERHTEETEQHINRIEEAFTSLDTTAKKRAANPLINLSALTDDAVLKVENGNLRDAAIIAALLGLANVEVANYQTLLSWGGLVDAVELVDLMQECLDEQKTFAETLTEITESEIVADTEAVAAAED